MDAITSFSGELSGELDGTGFVENFGNLSACDVTVGDLDGDLSLTRLNSVVAVVVDVQLGVDGGEFRGVSGNFKATLAVGLGGSHQVVRIDSYRKIN